MTKTQDFIVHEVTECESGWNIRLGPDDGDPWVTVFSNEYPVAPEIGDLVTVTLPRVIRLVSND